MLVKLEFDTRDRRSILEAFRAIEGIRMVAFPNTLKKGGANMGEVDQVGQPTQEQIHEFRKEIDAVIQKAQKIQTAIGRGNGGRETSLVVTKLQEGKMWAGKILEAIGSELPEQFRDKA